MSQSRQNVSLHSGHRYLANLVKSRKHAAQEALAPAPAPAPGAGESLPCDVAPAVIGLELRDLAPPLPFDEPSVARAACDGSAAAAAAAAAVIS